MTPDLSGGELGRETPTLKAVKPIDHMIMSGDMTN